VPKAPRRISFRFALLTLVVGLVLLAILSVSVVSAVTSARSVADLQSRYFRTTSEAIAAQVSLFLEPALTALEDVRSQVAEGRVDVEDEADLTRYLHGRLRTLPHLAWMSYSDEGRGRFLGIWRREDGALVRNRSDPAVDGGKPVEHVLRADGALEPLDRGLKGGYDPRTAAWYRRAAAARGPVWTDPFMFHEGRAGITAALRVPSAGDEPRGVLTADFFLEGLGDYLREVAGEPSTSIDVLTPAGAVVASSWATGTPEAMRAALEPTIAAAPTRLADAATRGASSWSFDLDGSPRIAGSSAFSTSDGAAWVVLVSVPEDRFLEGVRGNRRVALGLGAVVTLAAVGLALVLSRRISDPLRRVAEDLGRVARFDLPTNTLRESAITEIQVLNRSVEQMKASLRSFGRYVPTDLVRELLASGEEARLGGRRVEITIAFVDIEGFTAIAEAMPSDALFAHLGEFFEIACDVLHRHGGTVDKFIGDGILAFFNAPSPVEGHARAACAAALEVRARVAAAGERWRAEGKPVLRPRIGLHTGEALVGNVGTPERFGYTAVGDAVNLASRVEGLNKRYGTSVMATEATARAAGDGFEWRRLDRVAVVGRSGGTDVLELLGARGEVPAATLAARDAYEAAWQAYLRRDFDAATAGFARAGEARPGDGASARLLERTAAFRSDPPGPTWDGTDVATEK
jgi:adenylate cyclase